MYMVIFHYTQNNDTYIIKHLFLGIPIRHKNIPADCFPREWVHDFIKRKTVVNIIKMWKFSWFCNIAIWEILYNLRNYNGQKKNVTKTLLFAWNSNLSIFLGPANGVRFLRRFSFRCGIGSIFVALFVKSTFGTVNPSYITGLDRLHSVAFWTRVTSQVWTCVKYVPKQSIP